MLKVYHRFELIPLAAPSEAQICDGQIAGTAGSNPSGGMVVCCERCVFSGRRLCDELITRSWE